VVPGLKRTADVSLRNLSSTLERTAVVSIINLSSTLAGGELSGRFLILPLRAKCDSQE
jgi:hypothetical protein